MIKRVTYVHAQLVGHGQIHLSIAMVMECVRPGEIVHLTNVIKQNVIVVLGGQETNVNAGVIFNMIRSFN